MKDKQCLIDGCTLTSRREWTARGLCGTHYIMCLKLVKAGKHTWKEFENVGMSLPAKNGPDPVQRTVLEKMMAKKFK